MKFLVLLLTYIMQKRLNLTLSRRHDQWAKSFLTFFELRLPVIRNSAPFYLLIALAAPALALFIVLRLTDDVFFGFLTLFVHIVMLFLCLGCGFLKQSVDIYLQQWREGRFQSAFRTLEEAEIHIDEAQNMSPAQLHYAACSQYLYQTFVRYFMVIFWYMAIGPVGALLARLAHVAGRDPSVYVPQQMTTVYKALEWIPSRLLALSFALAGNFGGAIKQSANDMIDPHSDAFTVLRKAAGGAVEIYPLAAPSAGGTQDVDLEVKQMCAIRDLLNRAMIIWFILIALLTVAGHMG
ncbi:regulatory signaling modulator protein AmpE [Hahella sp. HN01]|uniref:regulatory signaling modulator protein AmpE n=1 Tax=unclassified Hahella TaxID=2624107 RepID=UPI001C1EDC58|nr:regulatory signaling modulator protein AmpE [Hahella sp. HN01]MBU6955122.1 regulatory signaling modulator protein AmpE [Hahella sp. HN01]